MAIGSTGSIVTIFFGPGSLHALAMAARNHRDAKLITGRLQPMGTKGDEAEAWGIKLTGDLEDDMVNHRMAQPAMFYRRSVVDRVPDDLHYAMDYALWVQTLAERGRRRSCSFPRCWLDFVFMKIRKLTSDAGILSGRKGKCWPPCYGLRVVRRHLFAWWTAASPVSDRAVSAGLTIPSQIGLLPGAIFGRMGGGMVR
jgi:hypothetical protein